MNRFKTVDRGCEAKRPTGEKQGGKRESYLSQGSHLTFQQIPIAEDVARVCVGSFEACTVRLEVPDAVDDSMSLVEILLETTTLALDIDVCDALVGVRVPVIMVEGFALSYSRLIDVDVPGASIELRRDERPGEKQEEWATL